MNAGMSDGCREVTRLRSTTTSWSTTLAPAFLRSPCTVFQAVMRWFLYSSAVSSSWGPWQIASTGLPAVMNALTNFTASSWARSLSGLPPPGMNRASKSSGLASLKDCSTVAFTAPLSPSSWAPASRPTTMISWPACLKLSYGCLNSESSNFGPSTQAILIRNLLQIGRQNHHTRLQAGFAHRACWVNHTCMQPQSSVSLWLDSPDDEDQPTSRDANPDLAEALSGMGTDEERPRPAPEPGQTDPDDALGAYPREIGKGTLLTKAQAVELAKQIEAGSDAA